MATHETKYKIGDKVFYITSHDGFYDIQIDAITRIQIGGKAFEEYSIGGSTRAERELFTDFEKARKRALEKQEEYFERAKTALKEKKPPQGF